jgi:energy-coupling factor transport system permease protein
MEAETYLDYNTFMHRLDARTKLLLFILFFFAILQFENPVWMLPVAFFVLLELLISRAMKNLLRIRHVLLVTAISSLIIWNIFASGETPLFWFVEVESFLYSLNRLLLILQFIVLGVVLISTTRNEELVMGMIKLGLPYRVGFTISTALRLVPTIAANALIISQAQASRGLDLQSGNLLERLRKYLPLLIPVFISTIRSTNIFAMALESRGFGARPNRSYYLQMEMRTADYVVLAAALAFTLASIYLNLRGYGQIPGLQRF